MDKLYDTPLKAIRKKCLDCSYWQPKEVRECTVIDCPIYPYRFGRRPDKATKDTLKRFREESVEPTKGY
jgi:hypothetical protein